MDEHLAVDIGGYLSTNSLRSNYSVAEYFPEQLIYNVQLNRSAKV